MVAFDTDQIARVERSWLIAHANHHYAFTATAAAAAGNSLSSSLVTSYTLLFAVAFPLVIMTSQKPEVKIEKC